MGRVVPNSRFSRKQAQGFSLIELLIVVAIILIIAAIAIPNLLRARIAANEASAATSVRRISTAEIAYNAAYPSVGCSPTPTTACMVDSVLASGNKSGYQLKAVGFSSSGGVNDSFVASSAPQLFDSTGVRNFCVVSDGVLRVQIGTSGGAPAPDVGTCTAYATAQ
jgi:type IV pilus assembly protein PilA